MLVENKGTKLKDEIDIEQDSFDDSKDNDIEKNNVHNSR